MSGPAVSLLPVPESDVPQKETSRSWWTKIPRVTWGIALILLIGAAVIASGAPLGAISLALACVGILVAWQFPYTSFYLMLFTAPLLSWIVSLSTGQLEIGDRAFGGAIDVSVGELIAACVVIAWALRLLLLWGGRNDRHWKPWLPLAIPYLVLVGAHLLSVFSGAHPDVWIVIKYSLRPILLAYILYVAVPVNYIRSKRRLMGALFVLVLVGTIFAFDGLRSLITFQPGDYPSFHVAEPMPILGVSPIGENHNVLAELMLFTAPIAFALAEWVENKKQRRYIQYAGVLMAVIALCTFARSAWIVFAIQMVILCCTVWKRWIKENKSLARYLIVLAVPLMAYFGFFIISSSEVQSSTDARAMLTGIALQLFQGNPVLGVGAGTFVDHVARTWVFTFDYGAAMDSHGIIQKLLAETGVVGFLAFVALCIFLLVYLWQTAQALKHRQLEYHLFIFLAVAVIGAFLYQLFNTTYWTAKLWLPVGIMFAGSRVLLERARQYEPDFLKSMYE